MSTKPDDVRIGDFSSPVVPRPSKQPATTKEVLDETERKLGSEAASLEAEIKPMVSYEDKLKAVGVTREQAARIIDAVLMRGYYAEDVKITSTIRARFRTRSARDTRRAQDYIEAHRPSFDSSYQEILSRQLLAASLEQFGPDKLPHPDRRAPQADVEKMFQDRLEFVECLSDPAMRLLLRKLVEFDNKIAVVLDESSISNF